MSRKAAGLLMGLGLIVSLGLGFFVSETLRTNETSKQQKPIIETKNEDIKLSEDTPIVYEKEYLRSNKVLISAFDFKKDILGKNLNQIREKYTEANGFNITFKDGSVVIHQVINDWSPEDKAKYRLKDYRGMLAVYMGPDSQNDTLLRVTAISISTLPIEIQEAISQGKYEFENEAAVNDALENLDEYF